MALQFQDVAEDVGLVPRSTAPRALPINIPKLKYQDVAEKTGIVAPVEQPKLKFQDVAEDVGLVPPTTPIPDWNRGGRVDLSNPYNKSAAQDLGLKYKWGGSSDKGADCSGYITRVMRRIVGDSFPRMTAEGQRQASHPVSADQLQPGDLVFLQGTQKKLPKTGVATHVGMYAGNGQVFNASTGSNTVIIQKIWEGDQVLGYGRLPINPKNLSVQPAKRTTVQNKTAAAPLGDLASSLFGGSQPAENPALARISPQAGVVTYDGPKDADPQLVHGKGPKFSSSGPPNEIKAAYLAGAKTYSAVMNAVREAHPTWNPKAVYRVWNTMRVTSADKERLAPTMDSMALVKVVRARNMTPEQHQAALQGAEDAGFTLSEAQNPAIPSNVGGIMLDKKRVIKGKAVPIPLPRVKSQIDTATTQRYAPATPGARPSIPTHVAPVAEPIQAYRDPATDSPVYPTTPNDINNPFSHLEWDKLTPEQAQMARENIAQAQAETRAYNRADQQAINNMLVAVTGGLAAAPALASAAVGNIVRTLGESSQQQRARTLVQQGAPPDAPTGIIDEIARAMDMNALQSAAGEAGRNGDARTLAAVQKEMGARQALQPDGPGLIAQNVAGLASPSLAGALVGGGIGKGLGVVGKAATGIAASVFGVGIGSDKAAQVYLEEMQKHNVNLSDPHSIAEFMADPEKTAQAHWQGLKSGVADGAMNAAAILIGGTVGGKIMGENPALGRMLTGAAADMSIMSAGTGTGALASDVAQGKPVTWSSVIEAGKTTGEALLSNAALAAAHAGGARALGAFMGKHGVEVNAPIRSDVPKGKTEWDPNTLNPPAPDQYDTAGNPRFQNRPLDVSELPADNPKKPVTDFTKPQPTPEMAMERAAKLDEPLATEQEQLRKDAKSTLAAIAKQKNDLMAKAEKAASANPDRTDELQAQARQVVETLDSHTAEVKAVAEQRHTELQAKRDSIQEQARIDAEWYQAEIDKRTGQDAARPTENKATQATETIQTPQTGQNITETPVTSEVVREPGKTGESTAVKVAAGMEQLQKQGYGSASPFDLKLDPDRFQFKADYEKGTGSTNSLQGVKKWNKDLEGVVLTWIDPADGERYTINGHNRVVTARVLSKAGDEAASSITYKDIQAPDAETAMVIGAVTNIAEGKGTVLDAAKILRVKGITKDQLENWGVDLRGRNARVGKALADLSDELFTMTINGNLHVENAEIIGDVLPGNSAVQMQLLQQISKTPQWKASRGPKRIDNAKLRAWAEVFGMGATEIKQREQGSLEGTTSLPGFEEIVSRGEQMADILTYVKGRITEDSTIGSVLSKARAAELMKEMAGIDLDTRYGQDIKAEAKAVLGYFDENWKGQFRQEIEAAADNLAANPDERQAIYEGIYGSIRSKLEADLQGPGEGRGPAGEQLPQRTRPGATSANERSSTGNVPGERAEVAKKRAVIKTPEPAPPPSTKRTARTKTAAETPVPATEKSTEPIAPTGGALFGEADIKPADKTYNTYKLTRLPLEQIEDVPSGVSAEAFKDPTHPYGWVKASEPLTSEQMAKMGAFEDEPARLLKQGDRRLAIDSSRTYEYAGDGKWKYWEAGKWNDPVSLPESESVRFQLDTPKNREAMKVMGRAIIDPDNAPDYQVQAPGLFDKLAGPAKRRQVFKPGRDYAVSTGDPAKVRLETKRQPREPVDTSIDPPKEPNKVAAWGKGVRDDLAKVFNPAGVNEASGKAAEIIRAEAGDMAARRARVEKLTNKWQKRWADADTNPSKQAEALRVIDNIETGTPTGDPETQVFADFVRDAFDRRVREVQEFGKLKEAIANYFPHAWKDPKKAEAYYLAREMSKRPFEGSKSFLKKRTIDSTAEGIEAGLEPVSYNPVDLMLLKIAQMDKFLFANKVKDQMRGTGLAKFVFATSKAPDGFVRVNDAAFTVQGGTTVPYTEAYDANVVSKMGALLQDMNIRHERVTKGLGGAIGRADVSGIKTKFASPESTLEHEFGHALDMKYKLGEYLNGPGGKGTPGAGITARKEMRALADLRFEGLPEVESAFKQYVREAGEKTANAVMAYIYAPERFKAVAPTILARLEHFIDLHPELKPMRDIKPSLAKDANTMDIDAGGMIIRGHWYVPADAARVINNWLSPGFAGKPLYDAARYTTNLMNQAQLGLSAFHLMFTSVDAIVSQNALGIEMLSKGRVLSAVPKFATSLAAPVSNVIRGDALYRKYLKYLPEGAANDPMVKAVIDAGGRVKMENYYKNSSVEALIKSARQHKPLGVIGNAVPAAFELAAKPIMEYVVPRQKLGVFSDLARWELEKLGPGATQAEQRAATQKAWDSVDNRMGQLVYDNLFWDRRMKDMSMISVRSVGWNLGTIREMGGGLKDAALTPLRVKAGDDVITHRMAYMLALPVSVGMLGAITQYLFTGEEPKDMKDLFYPRTGRTRPDGHPERVQLASYMKDVFAYAKHPLATVGHKVNPGVSAVIDMIKNEDFYGNEIRNERDPWVEQVKQAGEYLSKQYLPFSIRNAQKRAESGDTIAQQAQSFVGITPAPADVDQTPAEKLMRFYMNKLPRGTTSEEDAKVRTEQKKLREMLRMAGPKDTQFQDALAESSLSNKQKSLMLRNAGVPLDIINFKRLGFPEAADVYGEANSDERGRWQKAMRTKYTNFYKNNPKELDSSTAKMLELGVIDKAPLKPRESRVSMRTPREVTRVGRW